MRLLPVVVLTLAAVATAPGIGLAQGRGPDFRVQLDPATCVFTGGTDGIGNVEVTARNGGKKIQVALTDHRGYSFEPVEFSGPGAEQMETAGGGNARVVNIFNRNTGPANVKYSINLRNEQSGEIVACDPQIINR